MPYSTLMASALLFALNASSGYLSWERRAPASGQREDCRGPVSASTARAFSGSGAASPVIRRFRSVNASNFSCNAARFPASQRLQKMYHCADLLLGQNPVAAERRHHGQWIASGFHRTRSRPDRRGWDISILISTDSGPMVPGRSPPLMTWQVRQLPLAPVEGEFLALPRGALRLRARRASAITPSTSASSITATADTGNFRQEVISHRARFFQNFISVASNPAGRWSAASDFSPSAVALIETRPGSAQAVMHGVAAVSGAGRSR